MKKQKGRLDDAGELNETLEKRLDAADALLRESEDRFSTVFRASPIGIGISRLADGRFIDINDAFLDIYGYTREEIIGHCSDELNLWVDPIQRDGVVTTLRKKKSVRNLEMKFRKKSGEIGDLLVSAERIDLAGEACFLGTFFDITKKKKIEEAFRENERRYRMVLDDQTEVISRLNTDGALTYVNEVFCRFFGKSREEFMAGKWQPIVFPDDVPLVEERLRSINPANPVVVIENRVIDGTGEIRWMQFINRGLFDKNGQLVETQSVGRDITEQKQAEALLDESRERFSTVFHSSPIGIAISSLDNSRIIDINEAFLQIFGYTREEMLGQTSDELNLWPEPEQRMRVVTIQDQRRVRNLEMKCRRKSGEFGDLLVSTERIKLAHKECLLAMITDITERKRAEQELYLTKHCLDTASISILIISSDNRIVWVNDHACNTLGYSREELCAISTPDIDPVITPARIAGLRRKVKEQGYVIFETINQRKDGSRFPVEIRANDLEFEGKEISICFVQDISERKRIEQELINRQALINSMAQELSVTEERERLRIAEELHDQIAPKLLLVKMRIQSLVDLLQGGVDDDAIESIMALIDQSISGISSLTLQLRPPILANAGLEAALKWLGQEFKENYGLIVKITDDMTFKPMRYEIRSAIFQVVRELLLNIVKHAETKNAWITIKKRNDKIDIKVEDDGRGADLADFSCDRPKSGGFGICNIKMKIEHLGGEMVIDSSPGSGTRAYISAPLDTAQIIEEELT